MSWKIRELVIGDRDYELMAEVKKKLGNVYYDSAAGPYVYSPMIYRVCSDIVGVEKILFGTDYPLLKASRYEKDIETAGLDEKEKELIYYKNLARILKLD